MIKLVIPITLDDIKEDKLKYIVSKLKEKVYTSPNELYDFKLNFFNKHGSNVLLTIDPDLSLKSHSFKFENIKDIETLPPAPKKNFDSKYYNEAYGITTPLDSQTVNIKKSDNIDESITQDDAENTEYLYKDITKNMMLNLVCNNKPFKNCSLKKYGKGFLLCPTTNHPDWGTKYYDNGVGETGWWIAKKNAWFFKKEYIQPIIVGGANLFT